MMFTLAQDAGLVVLAVIGAFVLLVLIWLWYDLKLKALNYGIKATPENSFIQTK